MASARPRAATGASGVSGRVGTPVRVRADRALRRRLVTPEGVDLGVMLGNAGARLGAFVLDAMILILALVLMSLLAVFGLRSAGAEMMGIVWLLGFFVLRNLYFIAMELRPRAATLGKRMIGLRVVARSGGRLTADAVVARNLMREIEVFLPITLLFVSDDGFTRIAGVCWAAVFLFFPLFNRDRLRVGDLLAGTWVIRSSRARIANDLTRTTANEIVFTPAQLEAYGIYELETLEDVLRTTDAKARQTVADAIVTRIGWVGTADTDAFLRAYYAQLRANLEHRLLLGKRRADKFDIG